MRYLALGETRSLSRLHTALADLGIAVAVETLEGWSSRHHWRTAAREFDGERN